MKKKKKKSKVRSLQDKLDPIFSKYIRLRDSKDGHVSCITCGSRKHWKEVDAGHFQTRGKKATKYDERNVNAQCRYCNRFKDGEQYKHGKAIDERYGKGTADKLERLARTSYKFAEWDLEDKIEKYKKLVKELL